MTKRVTLNAINKELARRGHSEKIARGNGYFYFYDGDASDWEQSGVYGIFFLNDQSIERWCDDRNHLASRTVH